jgi:hypothetical protein
MPIEPSVKRAVTFVDGQNLFYAAKDMPSGIHIPIMMLGLFRQQSAACKTGILHRCASIREYLIRMTTHSGMRFGTINWR